MNARRAFTRGAIRVAALVSPDAAARGILPLFMHVGRRAPVRRDDEPTMARATRSDVTIPGLRGAGVRVAVWEWGAGARTVVLAHGWRGRTSQFATLVRDLVFEGYRVVAFDAPAHGDSAGRRTYLVDWIDVLRALQAEHGVFHAIVGHSFGALGALVAVADGVAAERVVTVAAPADADALLGEFRTMLGYDDATAAAVRARFARRYFAGDADPFPRISAAARPLPSGTRLLVAHDTGDRRVPASEADQIAAANPGARRLSTTGLGHSRILAADPLLDAILAFLAEPASSRGADAAASEVATREVVHA